MLSVDEARLLCSLLSEGMIVKACDGMKHDRDACDQRRESSMFNCATLQSL